MVYLSIEALLEYHEIISKTFGGCISCLSEVAALEGYELNDGGLLNM